MFSKQQSPFLGWSYFLRHQYRVLWRKGGLVNAMARPSLLLTWALCGYGLIYSTGTVWLWLFALLSLSFALALYQRYRLLVDTATSAVSSSAQGYVALQGTARLPDGEYTRGLPQLPVTLWLPGYIEDQPFYLLDDAGRCLLYPEAADIVIQPSNHHYHWLQAIYPGQTLYVLGDMRTYTGDNTRHGYHYRVSELLARWKSNSFNLLGAFDKNGDGRLCAEEWAVAVKSAQQLAREAQAENRYKTGTHIIDRSSGGRLFMISNIPPDRLATRYRIASGLYSAAWLGVLVIYYSA